MRIIDITQPISPGMAVYSGDPAVRLDAWTSRAAGDAFNVSVLQIGSHTGTHVDAPAHCVEGGATVNAVSLDLLCGPAYVLDVTAIAGTGSTTWAERVPPNCVRLLLRTADEAKWPGVSEPAARLLVGRGVRLLGIDRLSIAPPDGELPVHRLLLGAGVIVVEGLVLEHATAGRYDLYCLPLPLSGADGAPARAILVEYGAR